MSPSVILWSMSTFSLSEISVFYYLSLSLFICKRQPIHAKITFLESVNIQRNKEISLYVKLCRLSVSLISPKIQKVDMAHFFYSLKLKLNPWRCSSEEPRPAEVVAARWQYRGRCGQQSAYPSTLVSVFLTGFRYFSTKQLPNCSHEAGWTPFQTLYFQKNFQGIAGNRTRYLLDGSQTC